MVSFSVGLKTKPRQWSGFVFLSCVKSSRVGVIICHLDVIDLAVDRVVWGLTDQTMVRAMRPHEGCTLHRQMLLQSVTEPKLADETRERDQASLFRKAAAV